MSFRSDHSFPERCVEDREPLSSVETPNDYRDAYAAHFEQDVLNAVDVLGWEMVQTIVADVKAKQ